MYSVDDVREWFVNLLADEKFVIDKTGVKVIEVIGAQFFADEETIFGELDLEYAKKEIDWYLTEDLNVTAMGDNIPKQWLKTADRYGNVNSNYGWCIFSHENDTQYDNVLSELMSNPHSRRAVMIYNRPNMWNDYRKFGRNDFICTNDVQYFIRDNRLECIVNMRSNDAIWGYKNDLYWQKFVRDKMIQSLKGSYPNLEKGSIVWNAGSIHIYERHFYLVDHYSKTQEVSIRKNDYNGPYKGIS